MEFSAQQIAAALGGQVEGNAEEKISFFSKIEEGRPGSLTFLANPKYKEYIYSTQASVVLVNEDFVAEKPISATLVRVKNSYSALAQLLSIADQFMNPKKKGIDSLACISPSAKIGKDAYIGPFAVIGDNVTIGDGAQIYPHAYIGDNVKMGNNVTLYSHATIYKNCLVGNNVIIHAGAVVGSDGFGFAPDANGVYQKIPQLGNVVIEDDVEIGSNTCIDRSSMDGHTTLHKGVKLDNLIQIAHNVTVGENTVMAAQTGIAGSTHIGKRCMFGGQSGIVGHINVCDDTVMAARAALSSNIKEPTALQGNPAFKASQYQRSYVIFKKLPEMMKQMNEMAKEIEALKAKLSE